MPAAGDVDEIDTRVASDDVLARFYVLELACHDELNPGEPVRSREEAIAFYRHQPTTHTSCHWLADGGGASLYVHGPRAAFLHLLVAPGVRRRGIGSALLDRVLQRARELDVQALRGSYITAAGAAFAAQLDAVAETRVVRSLLDLPAAELPEPRAPDGFRILTWLGRVPDEHLPAYVAARPAMDDADDLDFPDWTAETVRASEASLARRQREMRLTVAIDNDGAIGSFTELRVSNGSTLGFTDDTATVASRRRLGLARAVKLESLRRLRTDHPEITVVSTSNAEENTPMRHLNETLGFRATTVATSAVLKLAESS